MTRRKDVVWSTGALITWDKVKVELLMDIRDELKESNRLAREQRDGLNACRHFFHAIGVQRVKLLVSDAHRKVERRVLARLRSKSRA